MSLEALAVALQANLRPEVSLTLIHLADAANDLHVAVPHLPMLAAKVGVELDDLRCILDELVENGLLSPVSEHPFDFVANTEGFLLQLDEIPEIEHIESPWSERLRAAGEEDAPAVLPGIEGHA